MAFDSLDFSMVKGMPDKKVPKVANVTPFGSMILIELLTPQEIMSESLFVSDDVKVETPQAYILAVGPGLPQNLNLHVGNRVLLSGTGVPVPNYDGNKRQKMLVEYAVIKGIIEEVKPDCSVSC